MAAALPDEFAELEPFCPRWLHATEAQRNAVRIASSMAEIRALYEAVLPHFEEIIQHLNRFPLHGLPQQERNLLDLVFSFVESSMPVERFNSPIVTKLFPPQRFRIYEETVATGV